MGPSILPADGKQRFILGGNAVVTFKSKVTSKHFTYGVRKAKDSDIYFVSVLTNADTCKYIYIGLIDEKKRFIRTNKSAVNPNAPSFRAFQWTWSHLDHVDVEIWHEGKCGKCGRRLTDPESIQRGFGPKCWNFFRY